MSTTTSRRRTPHRKPRSAAECAACVDMTGLRRAIDGIDPWDNSRIRAAIVVLAAERTAFECFDLEDRFGITVDHPNRWGALLNAAAQAGLIECVGYVRSRRPSRACGLTRLWRGTPKAAEAIAAADPKQDA
ncbi:hypothetical protein [Rhodococcus ruber]|uniref:hypothetical protein n=1 Tax=Rhodococcus ruber TaxID=1830 RepID=UPI001F4622DB|nr:hypothetical protein [Rhodococcus ruber]MCF8786877.1 hypothetical protein [Rhodococcus ruber]